MHSYTNDQNLIDNYHKAERRGRARTSLNMGITSTGAASAVARALPELKGKLTGNSIRVPTPNVSMAILSLNLQKRNGPRSTECLSAKSVVVLLKLQDQIDYTSTNEIVSSDFSRFWLCPTVVADSQATYRRWRSFVLYVWYDNELRLQHSGDPGDERNGWYCLSNPAVSTLILSDEKAACGRAFFYGEV